MMFKKFKSVLGVALLASAALLPSSNLLAQTSSNTLASFAWTTNNFFRFLNITNVAGNTNSLAITRTSPTNILLTLTTTNGGGGAGTTNTNSYTFTVTNVASTSNALSVSVSSVTNILFTFLYKTNYDTYTPYNTSQLVTNGGYISIAAGASVTNFNAYGVLTAETIEADVITINTIDVAGTATIQTGVFSIALSAPTPTTSTNVVPLGYFTNYHTTNVTALSNNLVQITSNLTFTAIATNGTAGHFFETNYTNITFYYPTNFGGSSFTTNGLLNTNGTVIQITETGTTIETTNGNGITWESGQIMLYSASNSISSSNNGHNVFIAPSTRTNQFFGAVSLNTNLFVKGQEVFSFAPGTGTSFSTNAARSIVTITATGSGMVTSNGIGTNTTIHTVEEGNVLLSTLFGGIDGDVVTNDLLGIFIGTQSLSNAIVTTNFSSKSKIIAGFIGSGFGHGYSDGASNLTTIINADGLLTKNSITASNVWATNGFSYFGDLRLNSGDNDTAVYYDRDDSDGNAAFVFNTLDDAANWYFGLLGNLVLPEQQDNLIFFDVANASVAFEVSTNTVSFVKPISLPPNTWDEAWATNGMVDGEYRLVNSNSVSLYSVFMSSGTATYKKLAP